MFLDFTRIFVCFVSFPFVRCYPFIFLAGFIAFWFVLWLFGYFLFFLLVFYSFSDQFYLIDNQVMVKGSSLVRKLRHGLSTYKYSSNVVLKNPLYLRIPSKKGTFFLRLTRTWNFSFQRVPRPAEGILVPYSGPKHDAGSSKIAPF